ncbi:MAG: hypothetical protein QG653_189 [Patescibacteria group bacterium]|nr:hypothetical protein [Patescibacteria group bacterium]
MQTVYPILQRLTIVLTLSLIAVSFLFFSSPKACSEPITVSLSPTIDSRFNMARSTIVTNLQDAIQLWNDVLPETELLRFVETDGDVAISFVYDERQRTTIQNERLKRQIAEQKNQLTTLKTSLSTTQETYEARSQEIQTKTSVYLKHVDEYKEKVDAWNEKGGAPAPIYEELKREQLALEVERLNLNNDIANLNKLADTIKNTSGKHNTIVEEVNQKVETINETALREFEEGIYDPNTKTIVIYEFESPLSLKRVLAHELGHALSVGHVEGKDSIMYPYNDSKTFELSESDTKAIKTICEK